MAGPKGAAGGPGETGDTGNIGPKGGTGGPGPQGNTGFVGPQGAQGPQGPKGAQGLQGPPGLAGPKGATGAQGFTFIGDFGAPGASGSQGLTGAPGPLGFQGGQGAQGPKGSQGFQGAPGFQGSQGPQGAQGPKGLQGTQGPNGLQGATGAANTTTGAFGSQGATGPPGAQGSQGAQGAQGDVGPDAITCTSSTSNFYNSCTQLCDGIKAFSRTFWQQTGGSMPNPTFRFRTQANCESDTCDWAGFGAVRGAPGFFCTSVDYVCGFDDYTSSCGGIYSDVRLKNGIETLEGALENIMKINAVEYDWNKNLNSNMYEFFSKQDKLHTIGLIAQNVRLYYPEVVKMNDDGYYSIDYHKLNSVLVEGIKDLQYEIEEMDKELDKIELILS